MGPMPPYHGVTGDIAGSTGFCGHVFSGTYELKNDLGSGSGKSSEDIFSNSGY
jgi:hypothetical protein